MGLSGWRVYVFSVLLDSAKLFPKWIYHYIFTEYRSVPFLPDLHINQILLIKGILPIWWTKYLIALLCIFLIIVRWNIISYIYWPFVFSSLVNYLFISLPHFFLLVFLSFSYGFEESLCILDWERQGLWSQTSCVGTPPLLLPATFGESPDFSVPPFPCVLREVNNKPYFLGLLEGLGELARVKCSAQDWHKFSAQWVSAIILFLDSTLAEFLVSGKATWGMHAYINWPTDWKQFLSKSQLEFL